MFFSFCRLPWLVGPQSFAAATSSNTALAHLTLYGIGFMLCNTRYAKRQLHAKQRNLPQETGIKRGGNIELACGQ